MAPLPRLSAEALATLVPAGWAVVEESSRNAIKRSFRFKNFSEAFSFMTRSALFAEKADHHPEWFNVYNSVDVTLSTHDSKGVTQNDIDMAQAMNSFAGF